MLDFCITGILGLNAEATESRACRLPANPPAKSKTAGFFLRRNGKRHRIFSGLTVDSTAAKRLRASTASEMKVLGLAGASTGPATEKSPGQQAG